MNEAWRTVVAVLVFLALVLFGAVGGCMIGYSLYTSTLHDVVGAGVGIGVIVGLTLGATAMGFILRKPQE